MCEMNTRKIRIDPRKWACARHAITGLVAVGIVIGSAAPATGQERDARRLEDAMPAEYVVQVREIAREASEAGVPPGLIARKAFEGIAKGYPPERVIAALDAYAGRLREARGLLGPDRRPASLAAAAEALRRGVPHDAIRSMGGRERGARDLAVPLIVLSDRATFTLPVGLVIIQQGSYIQRGLAFAAAFIASAPVLIFYAFFQRKIISGITTTGMAGQ